ncbi:tyrosine-type recombinase/integrase (plasmid) [Mycobacterium avium subsp. hominissuis]|uniref:tyrosine-type recombinase/integrase n=1 Tax=Mycobacterium avium TaxID=1764 RepID=UPI0031408BDB
MQAFEGDSWQQRWINAGCDEEGADWMQRLGDPWSHLSAVSQSQESKIAVGVLLILDAIRPSYYWLRFARLNTAPTVAGKLRDPDFYTKAKTFDDEKGTASRQFHQAVTAIERMMLFTGKAIRDLKADDVLFYRQEILRTKGKNDGVDYAWDLLQMHGAIPADALPLRQIARRGQYTVEEMVDFYEIAQPQRDVFVRYLHERAAVTDYVTLRSLAYKLCGRFWRVIQDENPGLTTFALPAEVGRRWKQANHAAGTDPYPMLIAVRAFYLDIAHWATQDAEWAHWAAPCFLTRDDTRGAAKHKRQVQARLQQKTRQILPAMPKLLAAVDEQRQSQRDFLALALRHSAGQRFTFDGNVYERTELTSASMGSYKPTGRTWATKVDTGERVDLDRSEDLAFWTWAVVNTFYYTGVRLEELSEITATALFTYRLPDGGVIPLLQIAPSKSDKERILMVPPELAHVLAQVRHRVRAGSAQVPCVPRYDPYERVTTVPLPYLFQRVHGTQRRIMSAGHMTTMISNAITQSGLTDAAGQPLKVSPHDFRRVFATDALAGGLPVHILARLMGHENINTTQGYTAIYQEDVINHYRKFVESRRSMRPSEEYREPTEDELDEFHQHFTKRKVELGVCGRAYGTPCAHEHAPLTELTGPAAWRGAA